MEVIIQNAFAQHTRFTLKCIYVKLIRFVYSCRFIFPVYPLVSLSGALAVSTLLQNIDLALRRCGKGALGATRLMVTYGVTFVFIVLSLSRIFALYVNYHAPMEISYSVETSPVVKNICLGKEWHRFPGSFFVPNHYRIRFVPTHFNGLLPAYFEENERGSTVVHGYFNSMNQRNDYMLFELSNCDYMIDFDNGKSFSRNESEPNYSKDSANWTIIHSVPFLNALSSHSFFRAFHVPFVGHKYVKFGNYNLLVRKT